MSCPNFPDKKVREIINRTVETGREHAFVVCEDGTATDIVSGTESSLDIGEAIESCGMDNKPVDIVHTHPNGVDELSKQDRSVAASDDVSSVCVAVEGGSMKCEMVSSCKPEVSP